MNGYKEYLDEEEAAQFISMSKSGFNKIKTELGIQAYRLPGIAKNIYKTSEIISIMEKRLQPWQPSTKEDEAGISNGQVQMARNALASLKTSKLKRNTRQKTIS